MAITSTVDVLLWLWSVGAIVVGIALWVYIERDIAKVRREWRGRAGRYGWFALTGVPFIACLWPVVLLAAVWVWVRRRIAQSK